MAGSKTKRIIGWVLSGLVTAFLIGVSAIGKFTDWEGKAQMIEKLGLSNDLLFKIGILEVTLALLLVIPRAGFLGAILLTGYLGGATLIHVRLGESFFFPVMIGVLMWIGMGLRYPEIFSLALGKSSTESAPTDSPGS